MADHSHHSHEHSHTHEQPKYTAYIPEAAKGHPLDRSKGYYHENLGNDCYFVSDSCYHAMIYVGNDGLILVDAPPTMGRGDALYNAINEIGGGKKVKYLIYSHSHHDHIGLGGEIKKRYPDVHIIAHEETKKQLALSNDSSRPLPDTVFATEHTVTLGEAHLELKFKGPNHDLGNIFIYAPKPKVLMIIDVIFPGWVPYEGIAMSAYYKGWFNSHHQILEYDFNALISGHLTRYGNRKDVEVQIEYFSDLKKFTSEAKKNISYHDLIAKFGSNSLFKLTKEYNDEVANYATKKMLEIGWRDRLGAIDEYLWNSAWQVGETYNLEGLDFKV